MSRAARKMRRVSKAEGQRRAKAAGVRRLPGEREDPNMAGIAATTDEGVKAQEAADELLASARSQGCTCLDPDFSVEDLKPGIGHLRMHHDDNCPMMRSMEGPG